MIETSSMSALPSYAQSAAYKKSVVAAREVVMSASMAIFGALVNVALDGELAGWNAEIPTGTRMAFTPSDFVGLKDPLIKRLLALHQALDSIGNALATEF